MAKRTNYETNKAGVMKPTRKSSGGNPKSDKIQTGNDLRGGKGSRG
jgi:hypothetical protein